MKLTHLTLMCGFCSTLSTIFQRGSDVSLRCDVPLLSESSTLKWIKDTGQTSNTTLLYNNSAYIILHNVDEQSEGIYHCILMENSLVKTVLNHTLRVSPYSEGKKQSIYRQSSRYSDLLLIFKSKKKYTSFIWTWESKSHSSSKMIVVYKSGEVQVKGPIKLGQKTSNMYDGHIFILHISPVQFHYDGTYRCFPNDHKSPYVVTILHTIRVYAESSGVVSGNDSVVLTCEVSDVSDSVTLVWLRMEEIRAVLVKQQILNVENKKKHSTVTVNRLHLDLMDWKCAVFTDNTLRAVASVGTPTTSSTEKYPKIQRIPTENNNLAKQAVRITLIIFGTLFAGVVLGVLVYYCYKKYMSGVPVELSTSIPMQPVSEELEPVYMNIRKNRNERAGKLNTVRRDETLVTSDSVIYASIYINNSRLKNCHTNKHTC